MSIKRLLDLRLGIAQMRQAVGINPALTGFQDAVDLLLQLAELVGAEVGDRLGRRAVTTSHREIDESLELLGLVLTIVLAFAYVGSDRIKGVQEVATIRAEHEVELIASTAALLQNRFIEAEKGSTQRHHTQADELVKHDIAIERLRETSVSHEREVSRFNSRQDVVDEVLWQAVFGKKLERHPSGRLGME